MSNKVKLFFGVSLLGILGVFTFKNILSSNNEYIVEKNLDEFTQKVSKPELEVPGESQSVLDTVSLERLQTLEKKTNQEKDEQIKSGGLSSTKKNPYQLLEPEESIELFNNHIIAENCLNYISTINSYGSVENAINHLTNETGHDFSDLKKQFEESGINCSRYDKNTENELLAIIDRNLIESAALGNEQASLKYASMLNQRSIFAKELYTHQKRLDFHRKSIEILTELSAKGHAESMLLLSTLLSDYVNFPETYDADESRRQISMYKSLTREDMSKLN